MARHLICDSCKKGMDEVVEPDEELCDDGVETVKGFSYLGDKVNASGGREAAVTTRVRIGSIKFGECDELLRRRSSLRWKRKW